MVENTDQKSGAKPLKPEALELMMQLAAEKRQVTPPLLRYSTNVGFLFFALAFFVTFAEALYGKHPAAGGMAMLACLTTLVALVGLRLMRRWGGLLFMLSLILDLFAIALLVTKKVAGLGTIAIAVVLILTILAGAVAHWNELR